VIHPFGCAALCVVVAARLGAQQVDLAAVQQQRDGWRTVNRATTLVDSGGRTFLRFDERPNVGMAWRPSLDFADGDIELDVRGRDVFQKSFVGVAFRMAADSAFDVVYLRPFNFRSTDPVRHAHAVQYASYPTASWERLRADHPGEYEAAMPGDVDPSAWVHLRLALRGRDLQLFVDRAPTPALHVQTLGGRTRGGVALWVGDLSPGDFANVVVRPAGR
jgi:hypothetical protein